MLLRSSLLSALGVPHGFSTRRGGVSPPPFDSLNLGGAVGDAPGAVEENLQRACASAEIERARLATVRQVHGDRVVFARASGEGSELLEDPRGGVLPSCPEADAVVALPGAACGIRVADCVPILLFDPESRLCAAVHAGWRGTRAHIARRAVEALAAAGASPARVVAAVGPAIGRCCYEVSPELAEIFAADPLSGGEGCVLRPTGKNPRLDLPRANAAQLVAAGLAPDRVEVLDRCTSCEPDLFFSHRRDQGRTGRHLALIAAPHAGLRTSARDRVS